MPLGFKDVLGFSGSEFRMLKFRLQVSALNGRNVRGSDILRISQRSQYNLRRLWVFL